MIVSGLETVVFAIAYRKIEAAPPARDEARPPLSLGLPFRKGSRSSPPSSTRWAGGV